MKRKIFVLVFIITIFFGYNLVPGVYNNNNNINDNIINSINKFNNFNFEFSRSNFSLKNIFYDDNFIFPISMDEIIDQQQTLDSGYGYDVNYGQYVAQSFKPSVEKLSKVYLKISKHNGNPDYDLEFSVRESLIDENLVKVSKSAYDISNGWNEFDFSDILISEDETYYLVCEGDGGQGGDPIYIWLYGAGNPYNRGQAYTYSYGSWHSVPDSDCCFKTVFVNSPPDTPSTPSGPSFRGVGQSGFYKTSATDLDGDMVQYRFDWDASGSHEYSGWSTLGSSGFEFSMSHSWNSGTYVVKSQARDEHGDTSGWSNGLTVIVTENNAPDIPSAPIGPTNVSAGSSYDYSTSTTDQDNDNVKYGWDWNSDGIVDVWTDFYSSGTTISTSNSWSNIGTYLVTVKAEDTEGSQSMFSIPLEVVVNVPSNLPPDIPNISGPTSGKAGNSYTYSVITTDPEGDQVFYLFDWDDGTTSGWKGPFNSGSIYDISHVWNDEGTYSLKVKAKDINDLESDWETLQISMPKNILYLFKFLFLFII